MKLTANSRLKIPIKIAKGIKVIKNTIKLVANNLYKKEDKIATRQWPAVKLANNRRPNDTARAKYETSSINTNNGTNANGVPAGTKNEKNLI